MLMVSPPTDSLAPEGARHRPAGNLQWFGGYRIGIVPLPIYLAMVAALAGLVAVRDVPSDVLTNILILAVGGFGAAELGRHIPYLRRIGLPAILATFIPSYLVYAGLLPDPVVASVKTFTKQSNLLYLFISCIIVGSILGMHLETLIRGFLKIFVPLAVGSLVAAAVGTLVGELVGIGAHRAFFYIVVPIMAGGVGEGAIPLSIGYAAATGAEQGRIFAQILPAVMMGSLTAILLSGTLNFIGRRYPHLTGNGRLSPEDEEGAPLPASGGIPDAPRLSIEAVSSAGLFAVTLFTLGELAHDVLSWPAPIVMLGLAVSLKLSGIVSSGFAAASSRVNRFFALAVTYPLLFAIGVAMTPWEELIDAFHIANLAVIVSTVGSLVGSGYVVARWVRMYPIDVAIVNACHSGQGGTGDVAILTASERLVLMPFAQIATRIGGGLTVVIALALMHLWG